MSSSSPAIQSVTSGESNKNQNDAYLQGGGFCSDTTIVIVGMRGAGKTTVGLITSTYLDRTLIDSDRVFERLHNSSIKDYVTTHGWISFREQETVILKSLLKRYATGAVIVLGGGVVDSPENVSFLKSLSINKSAIVLHVRRQMEDVFSYLSKVDASRTTWHTLGESYRAIWAKRSVLLEECSNFTFVSLTVVPQRDAPLHQSLSLKHVEKSLHRFLRSLFPNKYPLTVFPCPKFSWSVSRITNITIPENDPAMQDEKLLQEICQGADIVSFFVHLPESSRKPSVNPTPRSSPPLSSDEEDMSRICLQVARVSQQSSRPVNFVSQTPNNQNVSVYLQRVALGFKLACPFVEISLELNDEDIVSLLRLPRSSQTKILLSYTFAEPISWKDNLVTEMYQRAVQLGADLVRIYKKASSEFDCFDSLQLQNEIASVSPINAPLSAITLGMTGRMSHYLDPIINLIGHPRLGRSKLPTLSVMGEGCKLLTFSERQNAHVLSGITFTKVIHEFNVGPYEQRPYPIDLLSVLRIGFEALPMPFCVETATARHINGDTETFSPSALKRLISQNNFAAAIINASLVTIDTDDNTNKIGYLNEQCEEISLSARKTGFADFVMRKYAHDLPMRIFPPDGSEKNSRSKIVFENLHPLALSRCICDSLSPVNAIGPRSCAVIYGVSGRLGRETVFSLNMAGVPQVFAINCENDIQLIDDNDGNEEITYCDDTTREIFKRKHWKSISNIKYLKKFTDLDSYYNNANNSSSSSNNNSNNNSGNNSSNNSTGTSNSSNSIHSLSRLSPSIVILGSNEVDEKENSSFQFPKLLSNSVTGGVIVNLTSMKLPEEITSIWSIVTKNDLAIELCKVTFREITDKPLPVLSLY